MPVKTWVGRFAIVQGQPQEEGPNLRSFPRQRPDEDEDELYVLVQPDSAESEEYTNQLAEVIGRLYLQDTLSMTGAVQRALRAAHQQLLDWNQRSMREDQVAAGVACLAVRGRTAYLAQVGPVVAYHVEDGRVERIAPVNGAVEPLGKGEQIEPTFSRCQLSPGDLVLLASPRLLEILDADALRSILQRGANQALIELYRLARGEQEFSLVLLACAVEPEEGTAAFAPAPSVLAPEAEPPANEPLAAPAPPEPEPPAAQSEDVIALPGQIAAPEPIAAPPSGPHEPPEPIAAPPSGPYEPPQQSVAPPRPFEPPAGAPPSPAMDTIEEAAPRSRAPEPPEISATEWPAPLPPAEPEEPPPPSEPPAGLSRSKVRLKGESANIRYPRTTGMTANLPRIPAQALAVLVVIIVVGLIAWLVIPSTLQDSRAEKLAKLINNTSVSLDIAQSAADPQLRRDNLDDAEQSLAEAEALDATAPAIAGLRSQVDMLRTELDAVRELPQLTLVTDLSERLPGAFSSKDLALGGGGAYFLDHEGGRVIAVSLLAAQPEPVTLLSAGDLVGTEVVGKPEFVTWAEGRSALLIMDNARRLILARFGEAPRLLTVRGVESLTSIDGIAFAGGNLFILDNDEAQVWRYLPTDSGFDSEREPILPTADLNEAVELAVSSSIYVLSADGTIQRFQGEGSEALSLAGIDMPLESPSSVTPLAEDRVLVVDQGNKRIVALAPDDGRFLQQFKSASFTDLRALAVDEPNNLLYILVGAALYRTQLPPPPPPTLQ